MKNDLLIRPFCVTDQKNLIQLWHEAGLVAPQNNPERDIQRKLKHSPELFLVAEHNGVIVGSVMGGYDGHRGWVNYLAVAVEHQQQGIGQQLMQSVTQLLRESGCMKINLQVRESNAIALGFYEKLGYQKDRVVSYGLRLESD